MTCALTLHSRLLGTTSEILSKKRHLCPPVPCPPVCWAAGRKGGRAGPQQVGRKEPAQELPTCLQRWSLQPLRLELLSSGTGFAGTRELEGKGSWHRVTHGRRPEGRAAAKTLRGPGRGREDPVDASGPRASPATRLSPPGHWTSATWNEDSRGGLQVQDRFLAI